MLTLLLSNKIKLVTKQERCLSSLILHNFSRNSVKSKSLVQFQTIFLIFDFLQLNFLFKSDFSGH